MEENFSHLAWDTNCFGFNVARITQIAPLGAELFVTLRILRENNYKLAYWHVPAELYETCRIARDYGGFLVDEKVTYLKKLPGISNPPGTSLYAAEPYINKSADSTLIKLALQSSEYSRFRLDPIFPNKLCDKLYRCWILNSVNKDIAWEVLVVKNHNNYLGLITLEDKGDRANIGLVAIDKKSRGRGIGHVLITGADKYFAEKGFSLAQVVTQRKNTGACRLYESCGYEIDKIEHIFHFWF